MIKRQLLILFLLLATLSASAQVLPKEEVAPTNRPTHFSVGVMAGIDRNYHFVDMSYMDDYKYSVYAPGSTYGLQLGFSPWKWLTLRVDGMLVDKNYYRDHVVNQNGVSYPDTTTNQYINIPAVLQLNLGGIVRFHAFGGGYYGYWLTSHRKGRSFGVFGNPEYDVDVDFSTPESQARDNRRELGLTFGGGISGVILRHIEVGIEARWYYSVTDIQKPYMSNLNPRYNTTMAIQGGISYLF